MGNHNNNQKDKNIEKGIEKGIVKIKNGRIFYPNGKSYNFTDPEEKIRASVLVELIEKYKYPPQKLNTEVLGPRREPKLPADIVVYEDEDEESAFIVVETKAESKLEDIEVAKREGLGNSNLLDANFLLVVCGPERMTYNIEKHPSSIARLEKYRIADIPIKYGKAPAFRYKRGEAEHELKKANFNELNKKFHLCHDEIWEGGKRDPAVAFDEISKLLIAKLYDERFTPHGEYYKFQIGTYEAPIDVAKRIKEVYNTVQKKNADVFKAKIELPNNIIFRIAEHLQNISLRKTELDAKGRAFENFLGKLFRGEYGQYFTSRQIVEFMVAFTNPDEHDSLIDPACGSGGFLLYAMKHVLSKIQDRYKSDKETIYRLNWDFAHKQIFGIEINDRIARVAMMDMVIHEDGHSNIECHDALDDYGNFDPRKAIKPNKYEIILTNPPFGKRIKSTDKSYFKKYFLAKNSKGKTKKSEMSEILFLERCLDIAKEGGKIGIVLPDSAFTNKSNIPVVEYITKKAKILGVVSIPQHTFIPYGSMSKTSLLFLQKLRKDEKSKDYPVFMAHVEHIGYDATKRDDSNDLPQVLKEYNKFLKNTAKYPTHKELKNDLWITKIDFSQIKSKLDVEAYSNEYIDLLGKIEEAKKKEGFNVLKLENVSQSIFSGVGPKKSDYKKQGTPIIKTGTVNKITNKVGYINWSNIQFVNDAKYKNSKKLINKNDILVQSVAHTKEYIGDKIAQIGAIPKDFKTLLALSKFLIVRPDTSKIDPRYLYVYLASNYGRVQFKHFIRGMTAEIYEFDIKNIFVIVPPKHEQERIVKEFTREVKNYFQLTKKVEITKENISTIGESLINKT